MNQGPVIEKKSNKISERKRKAEAANQVQVNKHRKAIINEIETAVEQTEEQYPLVIHSYEV